MEGKEREKKGVCLGGGCEVGKEGPTRELTFERVLQGGRGFAAG